jgi:DNA-binding GntR family transcriptional regulator
LNGNEPFFSGNQQDNHLQLSEKVAMQLREQIVSGLIKNGEFLRIENIAKQLGVSPTPVREGLLLLQSEALVKLIPRRGFRVNSFSKQDLLDLFWAQATIGGELAGRAATRMTDEDINYLQSMQSVYEQSIEVGDERETGKLGHEFHRTINKAAESPRLASILGSLTRQLPNRFYASIEGELEIAANYHPVILGAIRLRDPQAANSLMFRHIREGGEHLVKVMEARGYWEESDNESYEAARPRRTRKA